MYKLKNDFKTTMESDWSMAVNLKPKLRTYVQYKHTLECEPYVAQYLSRDYRSILAHFRLGILPLHIETGRFSNTPRLCMFCNNDNNVEVEHHFLMVCPMYDELRQTQFTKVSNANIDNAKFIFINTHCQKQLALYLSKSWEKRQLSIYNVNS